jgi:hypothetical protein
MKTHKNSPMALEGFNELASFGPNTKGSHFISIIKTKVVTYIHQNGVGFANHQTGRRWVGFRTSLFANASF